MKLPRAGREYFRWPVTTTDTLTSFQVQLKPGDDWLNADYSNGVVSLLCYGPDSPDTDQGVLIAVDCQPKLRCIDTPEVVIRQGSWIRLDPPGPVEVVPDSAFELALNAPQLIADAVAAQHTADLTVFDLAGAAAAVKAAVQFPAVTTIAYTGSNVTSVTEDGVTTTYTYNGDGTVHTDTRNSVTRTYTYDVSGNLTGIA